MPKHHSYLEPFFGSGSVLFNKKPSKIEMINDLDNDVCNLFKLLREKPEELARVVSHTPFSRYEYDIAFELPEVEDELEKARRFLVKCWQGHGFRTNGYKVGWKNDIQGRENMYSCWNWYRLPGWIMKATDRLRQVQIENRLAIELIERFRYDNVFIYADPPYMLETRTGKQYKYEMSDQDHIELLEVLLQHPGPVITSGYDNELYNDMLADWDTDTIAERAEYGGKKIEKIWMNYKPIGQRSLFEVKS